MNLFRYTADMLHLLSFIILISKIRGTRNCLGIYSILHQRTLLQNSRDLSCGLPNQVLGLVFVLHFRLQHHHEGSLHQLHSLHNLLDKIQKALLPGTDFNINHQSYDKESDSFPHYYVYLGAGVLALLIHTDFEPFELSWSFSIWLESLAIVPQLYMLQRIKEVFTSIYT